jgi:hypothetical protein
MDILVKRKEFELPAEGLHSAVISRIEDLGIVETANGKRDKAHIFFMVLDQKVKHNSDAEVLMSVNKVLTEKTMSASAGGPQDFTRTRIRSLGTRGRTVLCRDPTQQDRRRSRIKGYHRSDIEQAMN